MLFTLVLYNLEKRITPVGGDSMNPSQQSQLAEQFIFARFLQLFPSQHE